MKFVLLLLLVTSTSSTLFTGVDLSATQYFESSGAIYRNENGQPIDIFQFMKDNTIDIVRLRLFTSNEQQAQEDPYNYGNTLNLTMTLAHRIKAHGLQFMLDFHYSDTWADPKHQRKPLAWANFTFDQLNQALFNYTRDSLLIFAEQNIVPEYIQIGNEINNGMLWPDGAIPTNWTNFLLLLNSASQAVRLILKNQTKIVVHSAVAANWTILKNYYDHLNRTIDFDVIGLSYYPASSGGFNGLRYCLEQLSSTYNKQIFIAETNYRWKQDSRRNDSLKNVTGFDETPLGQMQYAEYLENLLYNTTDKQKDSAVFWWATEYIPVPHYSDPRGHTLQSFFNSSGVALPIVKNYGRKYLNHT